MIDLLKQSRIKRGLSLSDVSKMIGYSKTYVSRVEHKELMPSREYLVRIAKLFDLNLTELEYRYGLVPTKITKWLFAREENLTEILKFLGEQ